MACAEANLQHTLARLYIEHCQSFLTNRLFTSLCHEVVDLGDLIVERLRLGLRLENAQYGWKVDFLAGPHCSHVSLAPINKEPINRYNSIL